MSRLVEMYRDKSPSTLPKSAWALLHLATVLLVAWLLFGGGLAVISLRCGLRDLIGSELRRALLLAAAAIYFVRTLVTTFVFLRRRMGWREIGGIALFVGVLDLLFAWCGGRQTAPVGLATLVGALLYVCGSFLNTGSEFQRHVWKSEPEHQGQLYTGGLFRYAMHINYFGDTVLFTGWALLTGYPLLLIVPLFMLCGFVFVNIPALDQYLAERYGTAFLAYAARTRKFIPFVY